MSGFEVDLDRLADFVGGALDGTPDAADVRHLVTTDQRWAEAYEELLEAAPAVDADLAALRAVDLTMPDDIAARLDLALAAAVSSGPGSRRLSPVTGVSDLPEPIRDRTLVILRQRRRKRVVTALATAAAVLVFGVGGVAAVQFGRVDSADNASTASGRDEAPTSADGPAKANAESGPGGAAMPSGPVIASGTDYRPDTIGSLSQQSARAAAPLVGGSDAAKGVPDSADELTPLREPGRRAACLNAITREYGGTVAIVDFARFEGTPALVVLVDGARAAAGNRWVVVVGPTCGTGNAIADERFHGAI